MTRAEQIEQAAKRYVKDIVTPLPASLVVAFVKGAEYADQHPINMTTIEKRDKLDLERVNDNDRTTPTESR